MIVITGASGQLGQIVVNRLLEQVPAAEIVAVVRPRAISVKKSCFPQARPHPHLRQLAT